MNCQNPTRKKQGISMVEVLQDASHEKMGGLTVHTGIHPEMGEIVIVTSSDQDSVLIHG